MGVSTTMEEFKIGDPILVRSKKDPLDVWEPRIYLGAKDNTLYFDGGWTPAKNDYFFIPFNEKTKDMLGSRMAWEETWEPKCGELVAVKDKDDPYWRPVVYIEKSEKGEFVCGAYDNMGYNNRFTFSWELCEPAYKHFNVPKYPEDA